MGFWRFVVRRGRGDQLCVRPEQHHLVVTADIAQLFHPGAKLVADRGFLCALEMLLDPVCDHGVVIQGIGVNQAFPAPGHELGRLEIGYGCQVQTGLLRRDLILLLHKTVTGSGYGSNHQQ